MPSCSSDAWDEVSTKENLHCSRQQCRWQCRTVCAHEHWWKYILGKHLLIEKKIFHSSRLLSSSLLATLHTVVETPKMQREEETYKESTCEHAIIT